MARKTISNKNPVLSHRGRPVNMGALLAQNGKMLAAGNARMNARGDILDKDGKIIKTREQIASEYYSKNPNAVPNAASLNQSTHDMLTGRTPTTPINLATPVTFVEQIAKKNDLDSLKKFDLGAAHEDPLAGEVTGYTPPKLAEEAAKPEKK